MKGEKYSLEEETIETVETREEKESDLIREIKYLSDDGKIRNWR